MKARAYIFIPILDMQTIGMQYCRPMDAERRPPRAVDRQPCQSGPWRRRYPSEQRHLESSQRGTSTSRRCFTGRPLQFHKLRPIRDSLVDTLRLVYLEAQQPVTVTMRQDRMYEFFGVWMNRTHGAHMQDYFAAAGPFIRQNGVRFIGDFKVVGAPEGYAFLPDSVDFIEWPSKAVKESWFNSAEFKRVGYHRALALDRLVVIESSFDFPQGM